jgi:hypothetical protein
VNALEHPESLRIAVRFSQPGEHVRIVTPSSPSEFTPLLPTGPE